MIENQPTNPRSRILVVDDEESIRYTFRSFLEDDGHEVVTAESYDQAMGFLREMEFDLVYVDIVLEGKSGMDLLKDSRQHAADSDSSSSPERPLWRRRRKPFASKHSITSSSRSDMAP